jgi:hypothetical protein
MIKDSQVFVAIFRSLGNGVLGMTASCPCGTDKVSHTIGGQGIVIVVQISFMGASSPDPIVFNPAKATKPLPAFRDLALVDA